jgi:hypothetical protein
MKILAASCQGSVVTIEGIPHPNAKLLTAGVGPSQGVVFLQDDDEPIYIPIASPDLNTTLEKLIAALGKVGDSLTQIGTGMEKTVDGLTKTGTTFTAIGAGMTGPSTAPPPTLATEVAAINTAHAAITTAKGQVDTIKGDIATIKGELETLKGNLQ